MKKLALVVAALLSLLSIGKPPDVSWITDRPICVDTPQTHVCGPTPDDFLGG